jgi:murein DD-endopeptidase MepM/ murein hydrolase activator NlpD
MTRRALTRTAAVTAASLATLTGLSAATAFGADGSGGIGVGGGGTTTTTGPTSSSGTFPVQGRHTFGDGIGAGRGHQGQDILAKCGKPVVAALPGRVSWVDHQSAAGNYVVIHGTGGQPDTVYMHLLRRTTLRKGQRVYAGDPVGLVGQTGDATTCHLHFEMWSSPGWEKGGSLLDPLPYLKRWARG